VRNLERAGVPRSQAMKMVGHKTESIYRRSAIVSEADLKEAAGKLEALQLAATRIVDVPKPAPSRPSTEGPVSRKSLKDWWAGTGLNRRHQDFQGSVTTLRGVSSDLMRTNPRD
jgi:hypothetical protein